MKQVMLYMAILSTISSYGQDNSIIAIKYIGISDKPISTIIVYSGRICCDTCMSSILDVQADSAFLKKIAVSPNSLGVLLKTFQNNTDTTANFSQNSYEFGSFEIDNINYNCKKIKARFLIDRIKSIDFFKSVIKSLKKEEESVELIGAISNLVNRIEF
jgi:hypothetical protein